MPNKRTAAKTAERQFTLGFKTAKKDIHQHGIAALLNASDGDSICGDAHLDRDQMDTSTLDSSVSSASAVSAGDTTILCSVFKKQGAPRCSASIVFDDDATEVALLENLRLLPAETKSELWLRRFETSCDKCDMICSIKAGQQGACPEKSKFAQDTWTCLDCSSAYTKK